MNHKDVSPGEGSRHAPLPKITILGVGNELLSDEGVGVHALKELQTRNFPENIEFIEGGTDGFGLINIVTDTDYLIVIDSLKGNSEPGTIYRFRVEDAPECPDLFKTSIHQISILEVLNLSSLIGKTPKTVIIGMEPKTITTGMTLSAELRGKLPRLIELIEEEVGKILQHTAGD